MSFNEIALAYIYCTAVVFAFFWDHEYDFYIQMGWMGR